MSTCTADFREHAAQAFHRRCKEVDIPIIKLAMFLDPRFKTAAVFNPDPKHPSSFAQLKAYGASILQRRGYSRDDVVHLCGQMDQYLAGVGSFSNPVCGPIRQWWEAAGAAAKAPQLMALAVLLVDIVPHAAAPERLLSMLGWYNSPRRNNLGVGTAEMMSTIRTYYQQHLPASAERAAKAAMAVSKQLQREQ